jgi:hypothetical protein
LGRSFCTLIFPWPPLVCSDRAGWLARAQRFLFRGDMRFRLQPSENLRVIDRVAMEERHMKKTLAILATVATVGATTMTAPAQARGIGPGLAFGLAAGAIAAGAAGAYGYYGPGYGYYGYGPGYYGPAYYGPGHAYDSGPYWRHRYWHRHYW